MSGAAIIASFHEARNSGPVNVQDNNFSVVALTPYPVGDNPFRHDAFHQGQSLTPGATNVTIPPDRQIFAMYGELYSENFPNGTSGGRYVIICDSATGQRLKVNLPPISQK